MTGFSIILLLSFIKSSSFVEHMLGLLVPTMQKRLSAPALVLLASLASAASITKISNLSNEPSLGGNSKCLAGTVSVSIMSENTRILYDGPRNALDLTQLFQDFQWIDSDVVPRMIGKSSRIKGEYDIFVKLCVPKNADPDSLKTVHVLTHGAGLDNSYWDMTKGYSYVDAATAAGFAALTYDRLGVGRSDHPDPIQIVQASAHAEIIHGLSQILRRGLEGYSFETVVGIGHSFGSWFTQETATRYPKDFDALVLTGTSSYFGNAPVVHSSMQAQIANLDPSGRFKDLPNGYIIGVDAVSAHQFNLYYYPHFEEESEFRSRRKCRGLELIHEVLFSQAKARQTMSIGEMLTIPMLMRPSTWTGPLDIVNGVNDFVYCAGNCLHGGDQTAKTASVFFPHVGENFSSFNLPETGHSLPGHHRAQEAYDHIFEFLRESGVSAAVVEEHSEL